MDWQQRIFHRTWHWLARLSPASREQANPAAVKLDSLRGRLTLLARLLTGEPIEILQAEREGGWAGHFFYLPSQFDVSPHRDENLDYYLFRVCYLSQQRRLGLNWPVAGAYSLQESRLQAQNSAPQVLAALSAEFPGCEAIYQCLQPYCQAYPAEKDQHWLLWGHWLPPQNASASTVGQGQEQASLPPGHTEEQTLREAPAREQVEILAEDREAIRNYTLQHYFEKVETIEEFQGTWRETDGGDDLSEHAEALQELDLRQVVRSDEPVHSVFQTEFLPGSSAPESRDSVADGYFISYDEWDSKKKAYKPDWCRVYPVRSQERDADYVSQTLTQYRGTLQRLRQRFALLFNQMEQVKRQLVGDELDLDLLVDNYADRRAGCTPNERVYFSKRRQQRDSSILLLMDLSLSTDGYTGGQRVLDVEKRAVILFAELLSEFGDRFQIDGFSSRTRHHCDYMTLKAFDEPWPKAAPHVGAVEPAGYTRIGPALRHATALMRKESARSRWIILISDGKPNDYDRYEGHYGLNDVRQAIKEARQDQIQMYGLAVEAVARHYLPLMLGQGSYRILPTPAQLPEALADFYSQLCLAR